MDLGRQIAIGLGTPLLLIFSLFSAVLIVYGVIQALKKGKSNHFTVFVAERYLFGKSERRTVLGTIWRASFSIIPFAGGSRNAINTITSISMLAIMVVTAALILVLSVFNGFQHLIENMYTSFDPDIRIEASRGKKFVGSDSLRTLIEGIEGVEYVVPTLEEKAMMTYYDRQEMGLVKGITPEHLRINDYDRLVYEGTYTFHTPEQAAGGIFGGTLAYYLNARISDRNKPVQIWTASETADPLKNPEEAYQSVSVFPTGYFKVQLEYDSKYLLMDFETVRKLFQAGDEITAYEVKVTRFDQAQAVRARLQKALGPQYRVETWFEQHEGLFKVMKNEKVVAYLILTLMLLIAGVNIIGGLSMVVVEKTRDIGILQSMGANARQIRKIFLVEGLMVGGIGGMAGMIAAFVFGWVHQTIGLIPLAGGDSYGELTYFPLQLNGWDFLVIFCTVFGLSILAALHPARKASQTRIVEALRK